MKQRVVKFNYKYSTLPTSASFDAADINETADTITIAAHPFQTGDMVGLVLTPTTGVTATVPALSTAYYIIKVDKNTVQLATSEALAYAGTYTALTAGSAVDCLLVKNAFGAVKTGIRIPKDAVVTGGFADVVTTFQSLDTIGGNADLATIAFSTGEGAGDLFAAVSIATGTTWDAANKQGFLPGVPTLGADAAHDTAVEVAALQAASYVKMTADNEVVMTIAVDPLTAGELNAYITYVV
jgi:hypothetical protein